VRRRFLQKDALREAIRRVVNATLAARLPEIWGEVTTAWLRMRRTTVFGIRIL
jgi:TnpA family transposase